MAGTIPQPFIDDLLDRTSIVDVVGRRIELKKAGNTYKALCPFHSEKTPSFNVNPDKQFYYCFGCETGGDAIKFVRAFDRLDFGEAVEALARSVGLEVPRQESPQAAKRRSENEKLWEVLKRAGEYFQEQLKSHPRRKAAVDYLKGRGLDGETAAAFRLGYAPPNGGLLDALGADEEKRAALLRAGLLVAKDRDGAKPVLRDFFFDRIMFPIRDARGRVIAFGGRVLGDRHPKYLNSPETPVFRKRSELYGLYEARKAGGAKTERLLLVEGYMDVIALAQAGIGNAVATLGTATSAEHIGRLFRQVPEAVFCFDGDKAGRAAARRAAEAALPLMEDGRRVRFLFLPDGADPDTHVRAVGRERFLEEVDAAAPLEQFLFDRLSQELDLDSAEGKARLADRARPLIHKLPDGFYAAMMRKRLAEILGMDLKEVNRLLGSRPSPAAERGPAERRPPPPAPPSGWREAPRQGQPPGDDRPAPPPRASAAVKAAELLFREPQIALGLDRSLDLLRGSSDSDHGLLLRCIETVQENPKSLPGRLWGLCRGSDLGDQLAKVVMRPSITPPEGRAEEFEEIIDNILSTLERKQKKRRLQEWAERERSKEPARSP